MFNINCRNSFLTSECRCRWIWSLCVTVSKH